MICVFCKKEFAITRTRDEDKICRSCIEKLHYCEVCGSVANASDPNPDTQLHYEEECFK